MMLEMDLDGIGTVKVHMEQDEVEAGKAIISHAVECVFRTKVERLSPWMGREYTSKSAASIKLLAAAIEDYLGEFERSGHRPESVLDYRGDFNQFIQVIGDVPVAGLQHAALNNLKKKLTQAEH